MATTNPTPVADLVRELRGLANEFDGSIAAHEQAFGDYVHHRDGGKSYSVAIVEHQLNKRDLGEEPRLIHRAAETLERQERELIELHDALDRVSLDWAVEMQARVSPPVSRTAAEAQELRDARKELIELRAVKIRAERIMAKEITLGRYYDPGTAYQTAHIILGEWSIAYDILHGGETKHGE